MSRNGDLGHLEGDIAAVAHDLRADLVLERHAAERQRPGDRLEGGLRDRNPNHKRQPPRARRTARHALVADCG
jgi:hypothetical protein